VKERTKRGTRLRRTIVVLALGIAIGSMIMAAPAAADFRASISHIWSHIKPKADVRYVNVSETKCPSGLVKTQGFCLETSNRAAADIYTASINCANAGRFLPNHLWLRAARNLTGINLDTLGEWSSTEWFDDANSWQGFAVHESGLVEPTADGTSRKYRCMMVPLPPGSFGTVLNRPSSSAERGGAG
jgi:hypothetical protein